MQWSKQDHWKQVLTKLYCRVTSEVYFPESFTCFRSAFVVHSHGVLCLETYDIAEFDGVDLVVKAVGSAMREERVSQAQRRERGESISDLQESTELAVACINAKTFRVCLVDVRWIGPTETHHEEGFPATR